MIRRAPLRWSSGDSGRESASALESGWFLGADECARVVAEYAGLAVFDGGAFGRRWPALSGDGGWAAPGLPVAVGDEPNTGVDGEYRRADGDIWREAGGVEALVLTSAGDREPPGARFDLLWFGDYERFLVREGVLEIEGLFALFRMPAANALLDRLLVRTHRTGGDLYPVSRRPTRRRRKPSKCGGLPSSAPTIVGVTRCGSSMGGRVWRARGESAMRLKSRWKVASG